VARAMIAALIQSYALGARMATAIAMSRRLTNHSSGLPSAPAGFKR